VPPTKETNPYEVLQINEDASDREITRRFHALARELHPDNGSKPNEEEFKEVSSAYERLTPRNRKQCDDELAQDRRKAEADRRARAKAAARRRRQPSAADAASYGEKLRGKATSRGWEPGPPRPPTPPPSQPLRPRRSTARGSARQTNPSTASKPPPRQPPPKQPQPQPTTPQSPPVAPSPGFLERLFGKLGTLVAALVFAAGPFGVMAIFISLVKGRENSIGIDLIGLVVGPGCFIWFCVGVLAVLAALGNLFTDW
jgi:DnaJ domain